MTKFTIDGSRVYEGEYCTDRRDRWNGFARPRFTEAVAVQILKDLDYAPQPLGSLIHYVDDWGDCHVTMDKDGLYPLGAGGWVWDEAEES